jgi:hypothetical protein
VLVGLVLLAGNGPLRAADAPAAEPKAAAPEAKAAPAGPEAKAAAAFEGFCKEWMGKLAVRERDNKAKIKWQNGPQGATGEYTGYSPEHTCKMKPLTDPKGTPVGTITYREVRYEQTGATQTEAAASEPRALEVIEVIEIFRYAKGKWVY